jgi:hypothetical protein
VDIQASEFSVGSSGENAIDGMLIGADKVRTRSDTNIKTSEPRDLPFLRSVFHFKQYIPVDVRPVEEHPDREFRHYDLLSTLQNSGASTYLSAGDTVHDCARVTGKPESAGINRHVVGDERALQERKAANPSWP